ncbi:hypothetical protein [Bdellovibrio svalbardensis]|uniref:Outer membrane protein beta-barrel domain-containing protein n=1 Tax=Bdellovibrio svalbardensis TaxID=2972972 RepID=A0ABT6DLM8_9BACT|nr:hypothetical protein [Bdellovibrio svalbardensis]MDG0817708.1 hypothetical protein [Bdellovibrio svalbardensis]
MKLLLMSALLSFWMGVAEAADQFSEGWHFRASIYAWLPSISGVSNFPESGSTVDVDAQDILKNLSTVFMGNFEVRKNQWGLFTDLVYLEAKDSKSGTQDASFNGQPLPATATADLSYELTATVWNLVGTYLVVDDSEFTLSVLSGLRLLDLKQNVVWTVSGDVGSYPLPARSGDNTARLTNSDFVVGVKGRFSFGEGNRWVAPYLFDVGTGQSDFTTQAVLGFGYNFGWGDVGVLWRYLKYDMASSSEIRNLAASGPAIGVDFVW